jgi:hypothetical protein
MSDAVMPTWLGEGRVQGDPRRPGRSALLQGAEKIV